MEHAWPVSVGLPSRIWEKQTTANALFVFESNWGPLSWCCIFAFAIACEELHVTVRRILAELKRVHK